MADALKRYEVWRDIYDRYSPLEFADGTWVRYADAAALEARVAELEVAAQNALAWLWNPDANANEEFERISAWFYRETGFLRPGKSDPLEVSEEHAARRQKAWEDWRTEQSKRTRDLLRAALSGGVGQATEGEE